MRYAGIVLAASLVLATTAVASDPGDQGRFDKLVNKYTIPLSDVFASLKPKAACVCKRTDTTARDPGFLVRGADGRVECGLPVFFADGSLASFVSCADYEVLGK